MKAQLLTPYIGDGLSIDTAYRPLVSSEYRVRMSDVTGTPAESLIPDVNLVVVEIECGAEILDAIKQDDRFMVLYETE